jgi:hypothetical protein
MMGAIFMKFGRAPTTQTTLKSLVELIVSIQVKLQQDRLAQQLSLLFHNLPQTCQFRLQGRQSHKDPRVGPRGPRANVSDALHPPAEPSIASVPTELLSMNPLARDLSDDGTDIRLRQFQLFFRVSEQEQTVTERVDPSRNPATVRMHRVEHVIGQGWRPAPIHTRQAILNIGSRLLPRERLEVMCRDHTLTQLFRASVPEGVSQLILSEQECLKERLAIKPDAFEHPKLFQGRRRKMVCLIQDEQNALSLGEP